MNTQLNSTRMGTISNHKVQIGLLCGALAAMVFVSTAARSQLSSFTETTGEHVVYMDFNGHIRQLYWNTSSWTLQDLTSISGAAAGAYGNVSSLSDANGEHVFYVGGNTHVFQLLLPWGGSWVYQDLTSDSGTSAQPVGYILDSFSDRYGEHVFYVATSGHICQLNLPWRGKWGWQDLTASAGGVNLGGSAAAFNDLTGEHVAYVGVDDHIHQLYYPWAGQWVDQDLTRMTNGPSANFSVTAFSDAWGEHVLYAASAGGNNVNQLYVPWGGHWVNQNLGTSPNESTYLTSYADVTGEHLYFADVNGHINQLYTRSGWVDSDLTRQVDSQVVANPCGAYITSFSDATGDHVFYLGNDANVHQLYWGNLSWVDHNLTAGVPSNELPVYFCPQ